MLKSLEMVVKYLHCIDARYEHFITHSHCQRQTNSNTINQELLTENEHGLFQKEKQTAGVEDLCF